MRPGTIMKKEKGFALLLTFFLLIALSTMSIAMLGIIQTSSVNVARSHQVNSVVQAAEYGIDTGRLWLVDQLTKTGLNPIVITNSRNSEVSGDCLALHGYTDIAQFVYYAHQQDKTVLVSPGSDSNFGRYEYEFYVQRIGGHTTLNGYNFIRQTTQGADTITTNTTNKRKIFYRVISCGYGPNDEKIVPLQGYFSSGGDGTVGNVPRSLKNEGFYRP